jgi:predicted RNA binding protein YcfA (HicA-like mRNA interferase family)
VPRLKCTFREFVAIIEAHGFLIVPGRQSGSHRQYKRTVGHQVWLVTVAYHNINDQILPDTLASMIRQSGLPKRLFRK